MVVGNGMDICVSVVRNGMNERGVKENGKGKKGVDAAANRLTSMATDMATIGICI